MKFQNPSVHGYKIMLCITKHAMYKCPNLQRAITHEVFFQNFFKSQSRHLLITRNAFINFQGSSFISFWDIMLTRFHPNCFQRPITQERGILLTRKKKHMCQLFFMRNLYTKFKNPSIDVSKVKPRITKHAMFKCPNLPRAITHEVFVVISAKVNQIIQLSLAMHSSTFTVLASTVLGIFCCRDFIVTSQA